MFKMPIKPQDKPNQASSQPFWLMCLLEPELSQEGAIMGFKVLKAYTPHYKKEQKKKEDKKELVSYNDEDEKL